MDYSSARVLTPADTSSTTQAPHQTTSSNQVGILAKIQLPPQRPPKGKNAQSNPWQGCPVKPPNPAGPCSIVAEKLCVLQGRALEKAGAQKRSSRVRCDRCEGRTQEQAGDRPAGEPQGATCPEASPASQAAWGPSPPQIRNLSAACRLIRLSESCSETSNLHRCTLAQITVRASLALTLLKPSSREVIIRWIFEEGDVHRQDKATS